jgi:hypothetical protein
VQLGKRLSNHQPRYRVVMQLGLMAFVSVSGEVDHNGYGSFSDSARTYFVSYEHFVGHCSGCRILPETKKGPRWQSPPGTLVEFTSEAAAGANLISHALRDRNAVALTREVFVLDCGVGRPHFRPVHEKRISY